MYAKKQDGRHKETTTTGTESLCQQMEADMKNTPKNMSQKDGVHFFGWTQSWSLGWELELGLNGCRLMRDACSQADSYFINR